MPSQDQNFEAKKKFIEDATAKLDDTFSSLSKELLKAIITELADKLERDGDTIKNTPFNLKLIAAIENIYNNFSQVNLPFVASQILTGADKINNYNVDYFAEFDTAGRDYKATTEQIKQIIYDRLGVTMGTPGAKVQLKKGGYMDSLLKDNTVKNQIKDLTYKEVLKNVGFQDFKKGLENFIVGDEERLGGFRQFYRNYAYSIFVDIDSTESTMYAKELDLAHFIYEGTLIDTSRPFCIKRAGKVFTLEEASKWESDPYIQNAIKKGYISSYNPTIDMGLHSLGCRHIARFISKETAEALRPDLKQAEPKKEPIKGLSIAKAKEVMKGHPVTHDQQEAIIAYTSGGYNPINNFLRGNRKTITDEHSKAIDELSNFLTDAPKVNATTYRGIKLSEFSVDEFIAKLQKGAILNDKGFISSSHNKLEATKFGTSDRVRAVVTIEGKSGVLIEHLSDAVHEAEVLFNKGTKMIVKDFKIKRDKNGIFTDIFVTLNEL